MAFNWTLICLKNSRKLAILIFGWSCVRWSDSWNTIWHKQCCDWQLFCKSTLFWFNSALCWHVVAPWWFNICINILWNYLYKYSQNYFRSGSSHHWTSSISDCSQEWTSHTQLQGWWNSRTKVNITVNIIQFENRDNILF